MPPKGKCNDHHIRNSNIQYLITVIFKKIVMVRTSTEIKRKQKLSESDTYLKIQILKKKVRKFSDETQKIVIKTTHCLTVGIGTQQRKKKKKKHILLKQKETKILQDK